MKNSRSVLAAFLFPLVLAALAPRAFAEANYVYHERTANNPGCGAGNYVDNLTPTAAQAVTVRFKVEYQNYTDRVRLYYTTDGSTPAGAFGTGSGSTLVVTGSYNCTFTSGGVVDVANAVIPAQPAGTTVKYLLSAWHSGGGAEIFANGPGAPCGCGTPTSSSALATVFSYSVVIPPTTIGFVSASGAVGSYYNGGTDGAGNSGPNVGIVANTANAASGGVLNGGSNPVFSVPAGFTGGFSVEAINVAVGFSISVYDGENATGNQLVSLGYNLNGNTTGSVTFAGTAKSVVLSKWSGGPSYDNLTFGSATISTPVNEPPAVTTSAATAVTSATATLNATINPAGTATTAQFEYGTTPSYGSTASITLSPNDGTTDQVVSANLSGLTASTTYYYRATAVNGVGTRNGSGLTFTTAAPAATALNFDGSNDSVDIPHSAGQLSYPFTVEAWVKTTDADGIVVSKYVGSSGNGWQMGLSGGKLAAWFFRPGGAIFPSGAGIVGATTINNGVWHHVAFVVDSTGGRLYVDGVSDGFSGWTSGTPGPATTTVPVRLGNETTGFLYPFAGTLDEVRIWSVARSAAELQTYKSAELAVMPPCLVGYYKFNQGTADGNNAGVTTLVDSTGGASGTLNNFALSGPASNWTTGSGITEVTSVVDLTAPEINLTGNAASIVLGDSTPDTADHTDFGSAFVTGGTVVRTFTVENTGPGASTLNVSSVVVSGTHAADFTVGTLTPASPVAGGTSATFTVTFDPSAAGTRTATITVQNDDCNESSYSFAIQGTGVNTAPTVATDAGSKLFIARYITANFIARANVDGSGLNTTHFALPNNAIGVTVDAVNGKLYWSSFTGGSRIGRMNLDGSGAEPNWLVGVHAIGMAVDAANGWLYLAGGAIKRVRLDGTGLTTLISGLDIPGFTSCSGVALDVPNNRLYYAFNTAIGRANLDGTSHTPAYVTTGGGAPPDDVAIDRTNGKLYWTVSGGNKIGRANVDGTGIESAFLSVTGPRSLIVDPQAAKVFWSDGSGVGRANLDGTGVNASFLAGVSGSWGIALGDVDTEGTQATRTGTYSDADGNTVTFSASIGSVTKTGTSSGTWTWTFTPPDGHATHNVTITANDGIANSTTSFTLNVNNIAPTATFAATSSTVNENTVTPPNVSFTGQTDPGTTDVSTGLKYSYDFNNDGIWDDGDGTYAGSLTATTKTIPASYFAAPAPASLTVKGRILDKDGGLTDYTVSITVNRTPSDVTLNPSSIAENNAANATVGTLAATDPDAGNTHTFTLVSGTGNADNGSFTIASNALKLTPSADFETKPTYLLRVRATDAGGLFFEKALTVTITDVAENTAPIVSAANGTITVNEGTTAFNGISFSDPEGNTVTLTASLGTVSASGGTSAFAGSDLTTAGQWRTPSVVKTKDVDGNNVYGTDGYAIGALGGVETVVNPAYATITRNPALLFFGGTADYRTIDDPVNPAGPQKIAGIIYDAPAGAVPTDFYTLTFTQVRRVRLGVLVDNSSVPAVSPATLRLRQTAGGTYDSGDVAAGDGTSRNQTVDYYFFDIAAQAGDVFVISGINDTAHPANGLGGIVLDSASWSYATLDGPAGPTTVTITATDNGSPNLSSTTTFTLNVNNVAPTATFSRSAATANENTVTPPSVSFTGQVDPGTTDVSTGLKYSYDFNNDGIWDDGDGTYAGSLTAATKTIPASYFAAPAPASLTVKGRILDKDGGLTDYTVSITVNHAPTAINGPLTIVEDFDYGASAGTLSGNGGAGFSSAWNGGSYTPTGLTFSSLTSPGGAWVGGSGSRNLAATLAAAGPITGDFLFSMSSAPPGRVQMFGLGGFNNQGFTIALAPANDSTPTGGVPIVGLNSGGFANVTAGAVALNTTYLYRFAYAGSSITVWILSAAQYDNFAPGGLTDAELNAASIGSAATEVTGRVTKTGNVTANMANLYTYTFGGDGVTMDRLRMTGQPVGASLVVAENAAINTSAGTLTPSDADSGNTFTFALVSGVGDEDNASFNISGSTVRSSAVFNYEVKSSYSIRVRVTDQGGLSYETPLAVTIANVNEAVTDLALSPSSIAENNATNATVGTLTATDNDTGDTHTFTLVGGTGSADNGSFTIAGSALRLTPSADFETKSSYALRVRATDVGGLFFEKELTVTITDVVEDTPPVVTRDNATVTTGEALSALNSGTYSDANGNATVTLTASIGTLTTNIGAGTWSWIYTPADGPDAGTNVIITANDGVNPAVTTSFTLTVTNRAPKLNQCTPPSFTLVTTTIPGWAAAPGDLDGDGDQDIVMGYPGGGISPVPFRNNGNATFTQMPTLPGAARVVLTPLLADYNGDGLLDVAVDQGNSYRVFFGNGALGSTSSISVGSGGAEASGAVADLNADGKPDFVMGINRGNSDNNGQVSVRLNNGSGGFPTITQYFVGPGEIFVTTADFNNDGKPDIAAADSETNTVTILLNNGSGGFAFAPGGPIAVGTAPKQLVAGDLNNDGFQDLAVPNSGAGTVTILLGNGAGGFTSAGAFTAGTGAKFVLAADFNNDSVLDLGVALTSGVALLAGNGGGSFGAPTVYGTGFNPINITLADMNADGGQDILVGFSDTVRYLQANVAPTTVSVNEGSTATNNGSFCDPGVDTVTVSASLGTVTQGSGIWGWSYFAADGPLTTNVTITATDSDGAASTYTFVLVVNNLTPTLSRLLSAVTTGEALTATNGGGFRDAGVDDLTLFANVGTVTTNGTNWTWSYVPADGPISTNVVISIVDSDNATNTTTFTLTVTNRAPTIALTGDSSVAAGSAYTLNLGAITDPGTDTVTNYNINWGDGNTESFSGHPTGLGRTHTYATAGSKTISVTLTDEDGTFASAGTKIITVTSLVASNLTVTRGRGLSLKIKIADLARDLNSLPVAVQSLGASAQGATLTFDSTRIYYAPANDNNDSFTYVVGNGSLTATGTVTVTVTAAPGGLAQSISVSGGAATLQFHGIPGYQYDVQRTTSLEAPVTWTTLTGSAVIAGTNGVFGFTDTNAPNGTAFYRSAQR
jgi:hypothetical protein